MNSNSLALLLLTTAFLTTSHAEENSIPGSPPPASTDAVNTEPVNTNSVSTETVSTGGENTNAEPSSAEPASAVHKYGPTKQGETLEQVARQVLTDTTINNEQMMWSLYTANPKAFEKGKLNRLRAGIYLTVPTPEQTRGISAKVAHREIAARTAPPKPKAPPAAKQSKTGELDAQIEEAKREREEAMKEQVFLKARLKEMEDKIQILLRENAERDAKLRAQSIQPALPK